MIDINKRSQLQTILSKLKPNAKPLWGKMSPQHILEHLTTALQISTGKIEVKLMIPKEEADKVKNRLIYSDAKILQGIKNPLLGDEPPPLLKNNFTDALSAFNNELGYFNSYYTQNPEASNAHQRMGSLKHKEWLILHNKHFEHHFKQYELI